MRINYKNERFTDTPWPKKKNNPNLDTLYFTKELFRFLPVILAVLFSAVMLYTLLPVIAFVVSNPVIVLVTVVMVLYIFCPRDYLRI